MNGQGYLRYNSSLSAITPPMSIWEHDLVVFAIVY